MYLLLVVAGLFSVMSISSMEQTHEIKSIIGSGIERSKTYDATGIRTIIVDRGCQESTAGYGRVQLKITQVSKDQDEKLIIYADDNLFPYIIVNNRENNISLGLYAPGQYIKPSREIIIFSALKNYDRIVTHGFVDTHFLSSINGGKLACEIASESMMHMPSMKVNQIALQVMDNAHVKMQENVELSADIISIVRKNKAQVELKIKTNLLQVENNGDGCIALSGTAQEQQLYLENGSFLAQDLKSQVIRPIMRNGKGDIKVTGLDLIQGTMSLNEQHDITYHTYYDALYIRPEEDVLQQYSGLLKDFSPQEILKHIVWEL